MEEKKRTLLAVAISCIIMLAVVYSFGLNFLRTTPDVVVADPSLESDQTKDPGLFDEDFGMPIEVTPETVQSVIASMSRYKSYSRSLEIGYRWAADQGSVVTVSVWADDGWTRCDAVLSSGITEHSILGNGTLWCWYDEGSDYISLTDDGDARDLIAYIPTYEDVLKVEQSAILDTGYVEKNGGPCIYVAVQRPGEETQERYWISVSSGLLAAAETEKDGLIVYTMTSGDVVSPMADEAGAFTLPDGTVLHEVNG